MQFVNNQRFIKLFLTPTLLLCLLSGCMAQNSTLTRHAEKKWSLWTLGKIPQIVIAVNATPGERDAAAELQKYLSKVSGAQPQIVEENIAPAQGVIYVGRTLHGSPLPPRTSNDANQISLHEESYRITSNAEQQTLSLQGGSDMATKFAVYGFLSQYCGVRWYMPTELFEVVPRLSKLELESFDQTEVPALSPRLFAYMLYPTNMISYPGERDPDFKTDRWILRNRLSADGRLLPKFHSHNLSNVIVPGRDFAAHPNWFPLIGGKRYNPPSGDYYSWQPEVTNPEVVQKFVEAGRDFFRKNGKPWQWFSLGINDGDGWSESEEANKAAGPYREFRGTRVRSEMYYAFVTKVAQELIKEFPDRKIGVIAYAGVLLPPRTIEKLPPNVNVVMTQESAQHMDPNYLAEDNQVMRDWIRVAGGNVYRYDYHGLSWLLPRYFPSLAAGNIQRMKEMGVRGFYTEDVPTWGNMGPMLWSSAQLEWSPQSDVKQLTAQFCHDLFGSAASPMLQYFNRLESIWMRPRTGRALWGLHQISVQSTIYNAADRQALNALITAAKGAARGDLEKRRVNFFAQEWELAEFYLRENELSQDMNKASGRDKVDLTLQLLKTLDQHATWYANFRKENVPLSTTTYWLVDRIKSDGSWTITLPAVVTSSLLDGLQTDVKADRTQLLARVAQIKTQLANSGAPAQLALQRLSDWIKTDVTPGNTLKNPDFHPSAAGIDKAVPPKAWQDGSPPDWIFWRNVTGKASYRDGVLRITGADDAAAIQGVTIPGDEMVLVSVRYRTNPGSQGWVYIKTDGALSNFMVQGTASSQERQLSFITRMPKGGGAARILLLARNQRPGDWVEFSKPYIGHKPA